jgi:glycerol transport system permease protein
MRIQKRTIGLLIYFGLLLMPIYWMFGMSLRTNADILSNFILFPRNITLANYIKIFTDESWYSGYINSMIYVSINTIISLVTALPAAYAFSRYRFLGTNMCFSGCSPTAWRRLPCSFCPFFSCILLSD